MIVSEEIRSKIESELSGLPIVQYAWLPVEMLPFSERVRDICRQECPRYGTSWACPPAVGSVEECRARCLSYDGAFVFTTVAEVSDVADMEETLATRAGHEEVTRAVAAILKEQMSAYVRQAASPAHTASETGASARTFALSGDSCAICGRCAYPDAPCRHEDLMIPCVEGYGIVVPTLAERAGLAFTNEGNTVTWFGVVLYAQGA